MEKHELVFPDSPPRHKPLRRSLSVQPEKSTLSSSPYSTRRKLKAPGRSLTEFFSHRLDYSSRARTDDSQVYQRRRTIVSGVSSLLKLAALDDDEDSVPINKSFSEPNSEHKTSFPVYGKKIESIESCIVRKKYVASDSVPENTDYHKRHFAELIDDNIMGIGNRSRKKARISDERKEQSKGENQFILWRMFKLVCNIIFWVIIFLLSLFLLIVGISAFNFYQETNCEQRRSVKLPISDLREQLSLYIIGQEIAIDVIIDSFKEIVPSRVEMPLILWMAGWTGSGKTQTTQILKDVMSNTSQVHIVIPSLLPQDGDYFQKEIATIFNRLDSCSLNLIIIDGWDEENNFPVKVLKEFLLNFQDYKADGYNIGKIVIVLSGTRGGEGINSHFIELHNSGKSRADLSIKDFAEMATALREAKILSAVTKQYVFVPFMPLEVPQVKLCIKEELKKLQKLDMLLEGELQRITQQILDQLNFVPTLYPLFADTGCKRVQPLLTLLLSGSSS